MSPVASRRDMAASEVGENLPIEVVMAADGSFRRPLAVSVFTLLEKLPPTSRAHVTVLSNRLSARSKRRLRKVAARANSVAQLTFVECGNRSREDLPTPSRVTATAYLRLSVSELHDCSSRRVIYMDSDVIVRCDITELWNQSIEGHVIAAVLDDGIKTVSGEKGLPTWRNIGLEPDTPYFNSGVMLIDIDRWRDLAIGCRAMKYLETYTDQLVFADQDALNAVIAGDWRHLDPRWNVTSGSYRRYREAKFLRESEAHDTLLYMIDHPYIIHPRDRGSPGVRGAPTRWRKSGARHSRGVVGIVARHLRFGTAYCNCEVSSSEAVAAQLAGFDAGWPNVGPGECAQIDSLISLRRRAH